MRLQMGLASTFALLMATAGCDDDKKDPVDTRLEGRVFAAEQAKPLPNAVVTTSSGEKATTNAEGVFEVRTSGKNEKASVVVRSKDAASVSKPAPKQGGYMELYVKGYDAEESVNPKLGGAVAASSGAGVKLGANQLRTKQGAGPAKARVAVAAPNPHKSSELSSIPGDFGAKNGAQLGKLSTSSVVYLGASEGDKELVLAEGEKASVDMPVHAQKSSDKAAGLSLYRFDETSALWVQDGTAREVSDGDLSVYRGQVSSLGWWAVGEFYDRLTCVRGCVRSAERKPAASARVVVIGIDHVSELTTYAGDDGCFALDVRAGAEVRIGAQVEDGASNVEVVQTSSALRSANDDPAACQNIGTLLLEQVESQSCPLGFSECGEACVDTSFDADHCGGCNQRCGTACVAGACEGATDAGMPLDAGLPVVDAGGEPTPDASLPAQPNLAITLAGSGAGTVSAMPGDLVCADSCNQSYPRAAVVMLAATPDAVSAFAGWSGDCATSKETTCALDMSVDRSASATFTLLERTLDVALTGNGTGSVSGQIDAAGPNVIACGGAGGDCSEIAPHGTSITLTAQPAATSTFTWGGACTGTSGPTCTVQLTAAASVSVTFTLLKYTLTVRVGTNHAPTGSGTVTSIPAAISCNNEGMTEVVCSATFDAGTSVELNAAGNTTFDNFTGWDGACINDLDNSCTIEINADTEVTATFVGTIT